MSLSFACLHKAAPFCMGIVYGCTEEGEPDPVLSHCQEFLCLPVSQLNGTRWTLFLLLFQHCLLVSVYSQCIVSVFMEGLSCFLTLFWIWERNWGPYVPPRVHFGRGTWGLTYNVWYWIWALLSNNIDLVFPMWPFTSSKTACGEGCISEMFMVTVISWM